MIFARYKRITHRKITPIASGPRRVKVGYPAGKTSSFIISKAIWNHFGTSRGIPERPFLRNAIRGNASKYQTAMKVSAPKILRGETDTRTVLSKLGLLAQGDIQTEITNLRTPPNAPSTIRAKGSSNPLIETGEMRQATTYAIE